MPCGYVILHMNGVTTWTVHVPGCLIAKTELRHDHAEDSIHQSCVLHITGASFPLWRESMLQRQGKSMSELRHVSAFRPK